MNAICSFCGAKNLLRHLTELAEIGSIVHSESEGGSTIAMVTLKGLHSSELIQNNLITAVHKYSISSKGVWSCYCMGGRNTPGSSTDSVAEDSDDEHVITGQSEPSSPNLASLLAK